MAERIEGDMDEDEAIEEVGRIEEGRAVVVRWNIVRSGVLVSGTLRREASWEGSWSLSSLSSSSPSPSPSPSSEPLGGFRGGVIPGTGTPPTIAV